MEYVCSGVSGELVNGGKPPVTDFSQIQSRCSSDVQVEIAIRVLSSIGIVVLIEWVEFGEDGKERKRQLIVLEPKWLIEVLKCVVTEKYGLSNATLTSERLSSLWRQYDTSLHLGMTNLLLQLDILIEIEPNLFVVPCLLPVGGKDLSVSSPLTKGVWRRAYVLDDGVQMPIGVGGRVVGCLLKLHHQLGRRGRVEVKRNGGVLVCLEDESGLEVQVWVDWWKERGCVYLMVAFNYLSVVGGVRQLRVLEGSIANILTEFYCVDYETLYLLDEEGSDFVRRSDVYGAMKNQTNTVVSCVGKKVVEWKGLVPDVVGADIQRVPQIAKSELRLKRVLGKGAFGDVWLADWLQADGSVVEVAVKKWRNDLSSSSSSSCGVERRRDREREREKEKEGEEEEAEIEKCEGRAIDSETEKAMGVWIKELRVMLLLNHPNLMKLHGVCEEEQPSWLILEFMKGRSLNDELTDPFGFVAMLEAFCDAFGQAIGVYSVLSGHLEQLAVLRKADPPDEKKIAEHEEKVKALPSVVELKTKWEEPLLLLCRFVDELCVPLDGGLVAEFGEAYERHWNERSRPSCAHQQAMDQQVFAFFLLFVLMFIVVVDSWLLWVRLDVLTL